MQAGAHWCDTPKELVKQVDIVMTMVGYPHDVEEVYFGIEGIIEHAKEGTIAIDFTTSTPTLAKRINEVAKVKNIYVRCTCLRRRCWRERSKTRNYGRWRERNI